MVATGPSAMTDETIPVIDLAAGESSLKMVLPEDQAVGYSAGDQLEITLSLSHAHLFDGKTGARIA